MASVGRRYDSSKCLVRLSNCDRIDIYGNVWTLGSIACNLQKWLPALGLNQSAIDTSATGSVSATEGFKFKIYHSL